MEQLGSHITDLHEILNLIIFRKSVKIVQVSLKSDKKNGYFTEELYIFTTVSHSFILRTRNNPSKSYRKNQNTCFILHVVAENGAIYQKMWRNNVQPDRPQMIV